MLSALPKSAHPGAKLPKATAKLTGDLEELVAFYDYPAEYRIHLGTTNLIESHLRHRTEVTGRPGSPGCRRPGTQTDRIRRGPLASGQRFAAGRTRPRRRQLRERQLLERSDEHAHPSEPKDFHSPVLTMAR
ncbi:hypothetical protein GCM10010178_75370 [Lentzea flava]|uniref:Uncharacterized protein n=1 Tax=Lentzea flava TaxID=103732 RepID=A0ABQ2V7T8_9PSEU|nr:hypothetical protein GCM10010178_75370 [Lentzea flava]